MADHLLSRRLLCEGTEELQIMKPHTYCFPIDLRWVNQLINPRKPTRESL